MVISVHMRGDWSVTSADSSNILIIDEPHGLHGLDRLYSTPIIRISVSAPKLIKGVLNDMESLGVSL